MGFISGLLFDRLPERVIKKWWDGMWPQSAVQWSLQGGANENVQDCLILSVADRDAVETIIPKLGDLPLKDDDKVRWVMRKLLQVYPQPQSYVPDQVEHHVADYWQHPAETVRLGLGDCDDWGILLYAVLRRVGIPAYRLKCVVGDACRGGASAGGHFNLIYLAHYDYEWYTLEGTWYPDKALERYLYVPRKDSVDLYGHIYFTFNEEMVWAQHDVFFPPDFQKRLSKVVIDG